MSNVEKTCIYCKWEHEDCDGEHCRNCIHNAEERFEPKPQPSEGVRLIDANALIEEINTWAMQCNALDSIVMLQAVVEVINRQPTAYNPEKVVEQADEILYDRCYSTDYKLGMKELEEVIRKGGIV